MTRQVTIVNTSNWKGEDMLVSGDYPGDKEIRLKPGQTHTYRMLADDKAIDVRSETQKKSEPIMRYVRREHGDFEEEQRQHVPVVSVELKPV